MARSWPGNERAPGHGCSSNRRRVSARRLSAVPQKLSGRPGPRRTPPSRCAASHDQCAISFEIPRADNSTIEHNTKMMSTTAAEAATRRRSPKLKCRSNMMIRAGSAVQSTRQQCPNVFPASPLKSSELSKAQPLLDVSTRILRMIRQDAPGAHCGIRTPPFPGGAKMVPA